LSVAPHEGLTGSATEDAHRHVAQVVDAIHCSEPRLGVVRPEFSQPVGGGRCGGSDRGGKERCSKQYYGDQGTHGSRPCCLLVRKKRRAVSTVPNSRDATRSERLRCWASRCCRWPERAPRRRSA